MDTENVARGVGEANSESQPVPHEDPSTTSYCEAASVKRRLITVGRVGLLLATLPYLFILVMLLLVVQDYFFSLISIEDIIKKNRFVFDVCSHLINLLTVVGSFCSFRALVRNTASQPCANRKEFKLGIIGLGVFLLTLVSPLTSPFVGGSIRLLIEPAHRVTPRDGSAEHLKGIYQEFTRYAEKRSDKCFPRLSHQPGKLMLDSAFMTNGADLADCDYFYLGYEIHSEAEMVEFARLYREIYSAGKWLEGDLTLPPGPSGQGGYLIPRMNVRPRVLPPDANRPPLPNKRGADIPVMIERIENNHNKKSHVLFLDGHVEFMVYPGRWPMTEKTISLLNEMDKMGLQAGAK